MVGTSSLSKARSMVTAGVFHFLMMFKTWLRSDTREKTMPSTCRRSRLSMKVASASGCPVVFPTTRL